MSVDHDTPKAEENVNRKLDDGKSEGRDDESGIMSLFLGVPAEIEQATAELLVHKGLRTQVCSFVRRKFPGVNSFQVIDVWTDTVLAVRSKAIRGTFRVDMPLKGLLRTIAQRRATDLLRHQFGARPRGNGKPAQGEKTGPVGDLPCAGMRPQVHFRSDSVSNREDGRPAENAKLQELLESVRVFTRDLPRKQRLVLEAFAAVWPRTSLTKLTEEVRKAEPEATEESVARARAEAFRKLRHWLAEQSPEWEESLRQFLRAEEQRRSESPKTTVAPDGPDDLPVDDRAQELAGDGSSSGIAEEQNNE